MLNRYLETIKILSIESANQMIEGLRKIPVVGNKIKDEYTLEEKQKFRVLSQIGLFLWEIIKIYAFVLLFIYVPKLLFSKYMKAGPSGFSIDNAFTYFSGILCCFVGSILHSKMFEVNEKGFYCLKVFGITPKYYFRSVFIYRVITEAVGFYTIFVICGMHPLKAIYLVLLICLSRTVGESFNIVVYKMLGKRFTEIKGASVALMLFGLFTSYFVPFMRGCVPASYSKTFNTLWIIVILVVGGMFAFYMWNNDFFNTLVTRVFTGDEVKKAFDEEVEEESLITISDKGKNNNKYNGNKYILNLYFERNKKFTEKINVLKLIVIAVFFVATIVAAQLDFDDVINKVILYSMPILVLAMYCFCDSSRICNSLFDNCDRFILSRNNNSKATVMDNFIFTTLKIARINAVPVLTLAMGYIIVGLFVIGGTRNLLIFEICLEIIILGFLFTMWTVFLYYVFQPYNKEGENVSKLYTVVDILMYFLCYACLFTKLSSEVFLMIVLGTTAVLMAIMITVVYFFGTKTFRIKNKIKK